MQIRSKLIAVLVVPLVALTVLAAIGIGSNVSRGVQADRVNDQTAFAVSLSTLVHELQRERDLSAGWVGSGRDAGYGGVVAQRVAVNQALDTFRRDVRNLGSDNQGSAFRKRVGSAVAGLEQLDEQRDRIENNPDTTVPETLDYYSGVIGNLLAVNLEIASQTDDRDLIRNVGTFVSLARLKEATSLERGRLYAVASAGRFGPGDFRELAPIVGAQEAWRTQFEATATPEQRAFLDRTLQSPDIARVDDLRNKVLTGDPSQPVQLDAKQWFTYMTAKLDLLRTVERRLADDVSAASRAAQSTASRQALLYTVILTLVLWFTVGLSLWMARSMVGPLRTLTRTANDVADERLPGLVDKLQHTKDPRDLDVVPEPVPVTSTDEIGQVSAAFNSVHSTAIQVATEQAALRRSVGDMFLNLARRSQSLIDRQLELIDDLERTEADPDALDNLFKLDHLATRMRRNAEDLIVLSGSEPARRWSQPVPLVEVVRAALAEVEDYNRVELLPIDDVGVAGQAVADVVHLLAELIENATSVSPPGTKVQVAGQQVSNGYVLEIEDRGLGMSDEELVEANERLANPPMVDFALSRMLGLYVVARLAQRYNVKVQLRHSWYGGITALVLLPPTVAVRAAMPEALEAPRRGPAELVPSTRPVEPAADETGEHLPIFEAARSDWFEDSVRGDHLPLRRHAAQKPNSRAAEPTGNGAGTLTGAGAPRPDGQAGPARAEPSAADAAKAEAMRAEAMRIETARMAEAAREEAARAEAAQPETMRAESAQAEAAQEAAPAGTAPPGPTAESPPGPTARADSGATARAEPGPSARTGPRRDRAAAGGRAGPLPTRTPGASGPPPGGAQPFAVAPSPGEGRPLGPAPASPPPPGRAGRRADRAGVGAADRAAAAQGATRAPGSAPDAAAPATLQAASVQTTKAGLPRRVPRANLAPGMVAARTAAAAATPAPASGSEASTPNPGRSPEEVRSMLSSYRSGLERGRMMAAGEDADRGGDAHSSSRSDDDDATQ
ncbi:MAG: nitrate- and nitrite sensing domain-containing protein [Actinomycetes bacterium]